MRICTQLLLVTDICYNCTGDGKSCRFIEILRSKIRKYYTRRNFFVSVCKSYKYNGRRFNRLNTHLFFLLIGAFRLIDFYFFFKGTFLNNLLNRTLKKSQVEIDAESDTTQKFRDVKEVYPLMKEVDCPYQAARWPMECQVKLIIINFLFNVSFTRTAPKFYFRSLNLSVPNRINYNIEFQLVREIDDVTRINTLVISVENVLIDYEKYLAVFKVEKIIATVYFLFKLLLFELIFESDTQVLDEPVTHVYSTPSSCLEKEPLYKFTGKEIQPKQVGEDSGELIFKYYPVSSVNYVSFFIFVIKLNN